MSHTPVFTWSIRPAIKIKSRAFISISLMPCIKAIVICAYCHGLLSAGATDWIIQRGGLRHE
jgi:hypothetical protein